MAASEALLRAGWRECTRTVAGLDLHVVEAGRPGDPLLILLHGFPEFWWAWRHQITPLAEAGYHVVVPDMRGYNTSDKPQEVSAYTLDILAADVVALASVCGAGRFHLVGHDWGAVIGWWVAAQYPHRLNRVVVMDGPHPDVWGRQALKHPTQGLRSTYVAFFQLPWVPEATLGSFNFKGLRAMMTASAGSDTFEPGALDRYAQAWAHPGSLTAMLNYYRTSRERPTGSEPARLAPPTLILWAGEDRFLERHVAEAGLALCDDGRLEIVGGATHWLHLEQPERINRRIVGFLAGGRTVSGKRFTNRPQRRVCAAPRLGGSTTTPPANAQATRASSHAAPDYTSRGVLPVGGQLPRPEPCGHHAPRPRSAETLARVRRQPRLNRA